MEPRAIANADLSEVDIPETRADLTWRELTPFALSFNAYDHWGSFERCAEVAIKSPPCSLTELRTKLFMAQRAARHSYFGGPAVVPKPYLDLLEAIRQKVRASEPE